MKRTPALRFALDDTAASAPRGSEALHRRDVAERTTSEPAREHDEPQRARDARAVLDELRDGERFVLVTHEHPDGDALGSLVAMHRILRALGKDSVMFIAAERVPAAATSTACSTSTALSSDAARRPRRAHGRLPRLRQHRPQPARGVQARRTRTSSTSTTTTTTRASARVDHVVDEASCTAEIVWDLMRGLGVEPTPEIAEALYVGLVTDTGRFMYENTGPRAHVMAADLIAAGVDVHGDLPPRSTRACPYVEARARSRRALAHVAAPRRRRADARRSLTPRRLPQRRRRGELHRGHHRPPALGRGHEGRRAGARAARATAAGAGRSRCARPTARSTSRSSPAPAGGGGHQAAAGFTTELANDELVALPAGAGRSRSSVSRRRRCTRAR